MRTRWRLLAALVLPLVDGAVLVYLAVARLGAVRTVALVVLTALVGTLLVSAEGRRTIRAARRSLARGDVPADELLDGGLLIAAGALLVTPGLGSDALGLTLALPLTRVPIRAGVRRYLVVPYLDRRTDGFTTGEVYVGGFPGTDDGVGLGAPGTDSGSAPGPGTTAAGDEPGHTYEVDIEDVEDVEDVSEHEDDG